MEDLIESVTNCHDAQVVGLYQGLSPVCLIVLAAKAESHCTTKFYLVLHTEIMDIDESKLCGKSCRSLKTVAYSCAVLISSIILSEL